MKKKLSKKKVEALKKISFVVFDFDGVFTDNFVYVSEEGIESVRCSRSDGIGLSKLRALGIDTAIISTEANSVVQTRSSKLKIDCYNNCDNKLSQLEILLDKKKLTLEETAFIGNDINDLLVLESVGFPVAVNDAYPEVKTVCSLILEKRGGHGAVREFCDILYSIKSVFN